jgi:hypothetical protein
VLFALLFYCSCLGVLDHLVFASYEDTR